MSDTELIQSQIDAAWQTGGTVQLEARDYFIDGLVLPNDASRSLTIRGAGAPRMYMARSQANVGTRLIGGTITYAAAGAGDRPVITIADLTIIGGGIRIDGGASFPIVRLSNVSVADCPVGVWLSNCENGSLSDVHVLRCGVGVRCDAQTNAYVFANVSAELCTTYGIEIDVGLSLAFVGGMAQSCAGVGMRLNHAQSVHMAGFHLENNAGGAIVLEGNCMGVAIEQSTFALPMDTITARNGVYGLRIVGGLNNATIALGMNVRATLIEESVVPANVIIDGAVNTRIIWDGVVI